MADPGSLIAQGFQNLGNGMVQGQQAYQQYQQQDAAATGQINAYLGQDPNGQQLSQDGQSLLQKQLAGNANRKDRLQLLGEMQTSQALKQQQAAMAQQQAETQQKAAQAQMLQMQIARIKAAQAQQAQNAVSPPPQLAGGAGPLNNATYQANSQGLPQNQPQQVPIWQQPLKTPDDPDMAAMRNRLTNSIAMQNGFDFDKASETASGAVQKNVDQINEVGQPVGFAAAGFDPKTRQGLWQPLLGKRGKNIVPQGAPIPAMQAPGPVWSQGPDGNYVPLNQKIADADAAAGRAPNFKEIMNSPEQNEDIKAAMEQLVTSQNAQKLAKQTAVVAQAYTSGNQGVLNAIKGSPTGQALLAAFGKGDAQELGNLAQQDMLPMVQQLRGQGQVRNSEINFLAAPTVSPAKGNDLINDLWDMGIQKTNFKTARDQAYLNHLNEGWGKGVAATKAMQDVPTPGFHLLSERKAAAARVQAMARPGMDPIGNLKAHPETADQFDQAFGPGTADAILNR